MWWGSRRYLPKYLKLTFYNKFSASHLQVSLSHLSSGTMEHVIFKLSENKVIKGPPKPYLIKSPPKWQNILEFECRGCEFVDFSPDGDWLVEGAESGTKFKDIDLSEGEWFEYDEKTGEEVLIKDIKWEIRRA